MRCRANDVCEVLQYFREPLLHLFRHYAYTPDGEVDLARPRSPVNVTALNSLTPAQLKVWQQTYDARDSGDNVCLRYNAYMRLMHGMASVLLSLCSHLFHL